MARSLPKYRFHAIMAFILIAGCAKISSPAGGPRDKTPPVLVKSLPANGIINFKEKKIIVTFNEYVVLDKITEKFMVSPPMSKKPAIFLRGKSVVIEYDDELRDSTTYTFNFQDAIRDLNEGNIYNNFQFVFSTGPVLDSLSLTGNIYTAYNLDPPKEASILLYRDLADSAFIKKLPDYITKSDKNGYFRIDHIRAGKYRLYGLEDTDNSKNFNLQNEKIAFMNAPVEISPEKNFIPVLPDTVKTEPAKTTMADTTVQTGEFKLILFQPPAKMHYLTSSSRSALYKLTYTLSLPPDTMGFDFSIPGVSNNSYFIEKSKEKDTIQVWLTDSTIYSQPQILSLIRYPYTDTTGTVIQKQDSLIMRFLKPAAVRGRVRKPVYRLTTSLSTGYLTPGQRIEFKSPTPLLPPDTSKVRLYIIDETNKIKVPFNFSFDSTNSCRMTLNTTLKPDKKYLFVADSKAFGNIYGEHSDSTGAAFSLKDENSFGSLLFNIKNYEGPRIIQLLSTSENVISERIMQKDGKLGFPYLIQGKYRIRAIYDLNADGKWTTGDFSSGRQPEPVSYYWQEMDVKEGWKTDQDWDISVQNIKKLKSTTPQIKQ